MLRLIFVALIAWWATVSNFVPAAWAASPDPNYLYFDGIDDEIRPSVPQVDSTTPGAQHTVAFWMFWDGSSGRMPICFSGNYCLELVSSYLGFNTGNSDVFGTPFPAGSYYNRWVHIAAVFANGVPNNSNVELYVNGTSKAPLVYGLGSSSRSVTVTSDFVISGQGKMVNYNNGYKFKGQMRDIRLYKGKLTPTDIANLAANQPIVSADKPLLGLYNPAVHANYRVYDQSGNGNHAPVNSVTTPGSTATAYGITPAFDPKDIRNNISWTNKPGMTYMMRRDASKQVYEGTVNSVTDWGLSTLTSYNYEMKLKNADGESNWFTYGSSPTNEHSANPLIFDGTNHYVTYENLPVNTSPGAKTTVEFWTYIEGSGPSMLFSWDQGYALMYNGASLGFTTGSGEILGVAAAPFVNKWVHIAAVFPNGAASSSNAELIINGEKRTISLQNGSAPAARTVQPKAMLGGWSMTSDQRFQGRMNHLAIFNGARTEEEVRTDILGLTGNESNLIGYWIHDPQTTALVYDQSVLYDNHGVVMGRATANLNVQANTIQSQSAQLTWDAVPGATRYRITNGTTALGTPTTNSFTATGLAQGTANTLKVAPVYTNGEGPGSTVTFTTTVDAPTGFTGVPGPTSVNLSWTATPGVNTYELSRNGTLIQTVTGTSYTDTGLTPLTTYNYSLAAKVGSNLSSPVTLTQTTTNYPAPSAPANPTGSVTATSVTLNWEAVPGATSYTVKRNGAVVYTGSANTFTDSSLSPATTYNYEIIAYNNGVPSNTTTTVTMTTAVPVPATPANPVATPTETAVQLSWDAVSYADQYALTRDGTTIWTGTETSYNDTGLTPDTTYNYTLIAKNASGDSPAASFSQKTLLPLPNTPQNLTGTETPYSVALTWDAVPYAASYELKRNGAVVYTGTDTTYSDTGLTPDTNYTYTLIAKNATGDSAAATLAKHTPIPVPATPTLSSGVVDPDRIVLNWGAVPYADSYKLTRNGTEIYAGSATTFTDQALTPATAYHYSLVAINASGSSTAATLSQTTASLPIPATPGNLSGTVAETSVSLTWDPVTWVADYVLSRDGSVIYTGSATSYNDTGLTPDTTYNYSLIARNASGDSPSNDVTRRTLLPVPNTPGSFTGTPQPTVIDLSWSAVSYATSYEVKRNGAVIYTGTATTYTDTGLTPATAYSYEVKAINASGSSSAATLNQSTASLPIPATPSLAATEAETTVNLTWNAVPWATAYELKRDGTVIYSGNATSYNDTGLTPDTEYVYSLVARNSSGDSASADLTRRTVLPLPTTPTGLTATATETQMTLTWNAVPYAATYQVKRNGTEIYNGSGLTYTDTGLIPNTSYAYEVTAVNARGFSATPATLTQNTADYPIPATPSNLAGAETENSVSLTWDAVTWATTYELKRGSTVIYTGSATSFDDTGLTPDTLYHYSLIARNTSGDSAAASLAKRTKLPAPAVPSGLTSTATETTITLSWDSVPYAASYKLTRNGTEIYSGAATTYTDSGLVPETSYHYSLVAINATGTSAAATLHPSTANYPVPATPANVTATEGETQIEIHWDTVQWATGYELKRDGLVIYTGTAVSFADTGLTPDTDYTYTLTAKNTRGTSTPASLTQRTLLPLPTDPTNVNGIPNETSVELTWDAVPYAATYQVKRNETVVYNGAATSFTDTNLTPDTDYHYEVVAINASGSSQPVAATVHTLIPIPARPDQLNATPESTKIRLSWSAVPYADSYKLTRDGVEVYSGSDIGFTDSNLTPDTTYQYELTAVNARGESQPRAASFTTTTAAQATPPLTPDQFKGVPSYDSVKLTWEDVENVTVYKVKRNGVEVYSGTDTTFTDIRLSQGTLYTYTLTAENAYGASDPATIQVKTLQITVPIELLPEAPEQFTASIVGNEIELKWSEVKHVDGYKLYRNGKMIHSGQKLSYTDTDISMNESYEYTLMAFNYFGNSLPVVRTVNTGDQGTYLPEPKNFLARVMSSYVTLVWDEVPGATRYVLLRDGVEVYNGDKLNFKDTKIKPTTQYEYTLYAENDAARSKEKSLKVKTKTSQSARALDILAEAKSAEISWNHAWGAGTTYELYRNNKKIYTGTEAGYTDSDLKPGTKYTYILRVRKDKRLLGTAKAIVYTLPEAPIGLAVKSITSTSAKVTWLSNGNPSGTEYMVKLDNGKTSGWIKTTSYQITALTPNTTYKVTVVSRNRNKDVSKEVEEEFTTS